jgi:hypothetical protein
VEKEDNYQLGAQETIPEIPRDQSKDVIRVVLGVGVHRLCLQSLHAGGIGRAPPLRAPRLLRPVRLLPRSLLPAPPVRRTSPTAHPWSPASYSLTHTHTLSLSLWP